MISVVLALTTPVLQGEFCLLLGHDCCVISFPLDFLYRPYSTFDDPDKAH